ncbi:MAG: hypothetical protein PHX76_03080 [Patescibacteria group bacterium]|nr:hypothetical protein [Patescibacteria group bacterium]MDD3940234.1 hypothetical protein [Candidatus Paceibacterota bacterium]
MLKFILVFVAIVLVIALLFFIFLVLSIRRDNAKKDEKIIKEVIDESEKNRLLSAVKEINEIVKQK